MIIRNIITHSYIAYLQLTPKLSLREDA